MAMATLWNQFATDTNDSMTADVIDITQTGTSCAELGVQSN